MQEMIDGFRAQKLAQAAAGGPAPSIEALRAAFAPAGRRFPMPADVEVVAVDAAGVLAHWVTTPGARPDRVLFYLHGGGYTVGDLDSHGELAARLGRAARATVLFPEYRRWPEAPFPAAVHDVARAWAWLTGEGFVPTGVVLAGDSSGGGLALGLLQTLRDTAEDVPAGAILLSPHLDVLGTGVSMAEREDADPIFTAAMVRGLGAGWLAHGDPDDPRASPLLAPMDGLPPLLVQVGSDEVLFSDAERLARRARLEGVDVTFSVGEGLPHVFQALPGTPESDAAIAEAAAFADRVLARV